MFQFFVDDVLYIFHGALHRNCFSALGELSQNTLTEKQIQIELDLPTGKQTQFLRTHVMCLLLHPDLFDRLYFSMS